MKHAGVYGAKCGAVLGLLPGAVLAIMFYAISFGFWDKPFVTALFVFGLISGGVVAVGALLGGVVGMVVEGTRNWNRQTDRAA